MDHRFIRALSFPESEYNQPLVIDLPGHGSSHGTSSNNIQFYMTDYEHHYLRGAVYFNSSPNQDSIQPALDLVREDMLHLFESFSWR